MKHEESRERLVNATKSRTGINVKYTRSRRREVILAKACVINALSKYFGANTVQIGELFDMHHSTIVHHLKCHHHRYRYEDEYASLYDYLIKICMNHDRDTIDVDGTLGLIKTALVV